MATLPTIYVLNGPNLNLLGLREPEIYGARHARRHRRARSRTGPASSASGVDMRQSNHEGHLIDWLHEANAEGAKAVILNAGGFTHTSVAIHDAIKAIKVPVIEVHLSNPQARESFRQQSLIALGGEGQHRRIRRAGLSAGSGRGRPSLTGRARGNRGFPQGKEKYGRQESGDRGGMRVDTDLVRQLAELLHENDLSEIEVEDGDRRIVVKRQISAAAGRRRASAAARRRGRAARRRRARGRGRARQPSRRGQVADGRHRLPRRRAGRQAVRRRPATRSSEGDTLLIVEAMKVMNPITAPRAGTVRADPRPGRPAGRI